MTMTISSWRDLRTGEAAILDAIRSARFGAQLFLADPIRFLHESGFVVGSAFAQELGGLPGVRANPKGAYDEILAGGHPFCRRTVHISGLGLPPGLGEKPARSQGPRPPAVST